MNTGRIEKRIVLKASRARVWRALTDAQEFGKWFRCNLKGAFAEGATVRGNVTYPGYEHLKVEMMVEKIQPQTLFSYRWHPYPADPKADYAKETPTLVEFTLDEAPGGILLKVVESGFEKIPAARREEAFRMNDGGWAEQMKNIETHVAAG